MKRIVIAISGATGVPLAIGVLRELQKNADYETHLIISESSEVTIQTETDMTLADIRALADYNYENADISAPIASGTFDCEGLIIVPCSMKTLAGIASGYACNLILRAADVTLKEGRKLVLVARESPLSYIHLRNLLEVKKAGASIVPPMISYYNLPKTVEDITDQIVGKILDQYGINSVKFKRWRDNNE